MGKLDDRLAKTLRSNEQSDRQSLKDLPMQRKSSHGAMRVEAARAQTLENLADLLAVSNRRKGPFLIELVIP
jgi:hypothetical protein